MASTKNDQFCDPPPAPPPFAKMNNTHRRMGENVLRGQS